MYVESATIQKFYQMNDEAQVKRWEYHMGETYNSWTLHALYKV